MDLVSKDNSTIPKEIISLKDLFGFYPVQKNILKYLSDEDKINLNDQHPSSLRTHSSFPTDL